MAVGKSGLATLSLIAILVALMCLQPTASTDVAPDTGHAGMPGMHRIPIFGHAYLGWPPPLPDLHDGHAAVAYGQTSDSGAVPIAYPIDTVEIDGRQNRVPTFPQGEFGASVASIGDVDGDGVADFAVGSPGADTLNCADCGLVQILLMRDKDTVKTASSIRNGISNAPALAAGDRFGASIAAIGDIDGNGVADLAVGAPGHKEGSGAVWIIAMETPTRVKSSFMVDDIIPGSPELSVGKRFGASVAGIGDIDGNGVMDVIVGQPLGDRGLSIRNGEIRVILLNNETSVKGKGTYLYSDIPDRPTQIDARFGASMARIGDMSHNGTVNVAVGAPGSVQGGLTGGAVYVLKLGYGGGSASFDVLSRIDGSLGNGPPHEDLSAFGHSVASLGDIDRDGGVDLAVGAPSNFRDSDGDGALHLVFLSRDWSPRATITIDGNARNGPAATARDGFASSVSAIGDADGNGITDVIVGAPNYTTGTAGNGTVHRILLDAMIHVGTGGMGGHHRVTLPAGTTLDDGGRFGLSVANAGDLNRDGIQDLVVGEPFGNARVGGTPQGKVYSLLMNADGSVSAAQSHGRGTQFGGYGISAASIGDVNGDGINDIAVGQPQKSFDSGPNRGERGSLHIHYLDSAGRQTSNFEYTSINDLVDHSIRFGYSAVSLGELFNNGTDYIAVGGPGKLGGALYVLSVHYDPGQPKPSLVNVLTLNRDTSGLSRAIGGWFGSSVAAIGDVDGNGVVDLAVGSVRYVFELGGNYAIPDSPGSVNVLLLERSGGTLAVKSVRTIDENNTDLDAKDGFGASVAPVGDLDGNGVPDIAVGASGRGSNDKGSAFVIFLNSSGAMEEIVEMDTQALRLDDKSYLGESVANIGDYNGDGIADLAVGAPLYTGKGESVQGTGRLYILTLDKAAFAYGVSSDTQDGHYNSGTITINVHFSEPVIVTGQPRVKMDVDNRLAGTGVTTDKYANLQSGNGTSKLTFAYVIQSGDDADDLNYESETSLDLNGGTIRAAAPPNGDARTTLPPPDLAVGIRPGGSAGPLALNSEIVIDTVSPAVSIESPADGSAVSSRGAEFRATATDDKSGNITSSIRWTSGGNNIGTGGTITPTLSPGTHTIFASATDSAGNQGSAVVTVVVEDDTPPSVSGADIDLDNTRTNILRVTFDRTVDLTPASNVNLTKFHIRQSGQATGGVSMDGAAIIPDAGDAKTVSILISDDQRKGILALGQSSLELDVDAGAVMTVNRIGNPDDHDNAISVTPDTTKPAILDVNISQELTGQQLVVVFNETMDVSATDLAKVTISNDTAGSAGDISAAGYVIATAEDDTRIEIGITASQLSEIRSLGDRIYLKVDAAAFRDLAGNAIDGHVVPFSGVDVPPAIRLVAGADGVVHRGTIPFTVMFSEPVTDLDASGILASSGAIQNLQRHGAFSFGHPGSGDGELNNPAGVAINSTGHVFVADGGNHRVQVFDPFGEYVADFGGRGRGNGSFDGPAGIAVNSTGHVFVADANNDRIQVFDPSGQYVSKFGTKGTANGMMDRPEDVAINGTGYIYVADANNDRIQVFDPSGQYVSGFNASSSGNRGFSGPTGIAINSTGHVYVAEKHKHLVQVFGPSGQYVSEFGTWGTADGRFVSPTGVAINSTGHVYVSDGATYVDGTRRIQVFDSAGGHLSTLTSLGSIQLAQSTRMAFDSKDVLYVPTAGHNVVVQRDGYSFDLANPEQGELTVSIPAGSVQDASGIDNTASNTIRLTIIETPDAPTGLAAIHGNGQVELTWGAPSDDGGSPITDYAVQYSGDAGATWSAFDDGVSADTDATVTGLTNGQAYQFRVNATNAAGTGAASNIAEATPSTAPSEPRGLAAVQNGMIVTLTWVAPIADGGSPVSGYTVQYKPSSEQWPGTSVDIGDLTTHDIAGLTDGTTYDFRVNATNAAGTGDAPDAVSLRFDVTAPSAALSSTAPDPTPSPSSVPFTVKFSENVTGFGAPDVSASSGTVRNLVPPTGYFGGQGAGNGQFASPQRVAVSPAGHVFVTDTSKDNVQVFDGAGRYVSQLGMGGTGPGQFQNPYGIAVNSTGHVFVMDTGNDRVQIFDPSGKYVSQFGSGGSGNGEFGGARAIGVDGEDRVYVADFDNERVQIFDPSGGYVSQFGMRGFGNGGFISPLGIAVNATGHIFVTDIAKDNVQVFDSSGTYVSQFGMRGTGPGQFEDPRGIAIDPKGRVYVADSQNDRILVFDGGGGYLSQLGGDGQFDYTTDVAVGHEGYVYAVDNDNHRIYLQRDNTYSFDVANPEQGQLSVGIPADSAQDAAGNNNTASNTIRLTVIVAPGAPTGLAATPGDGRVLLSWAAPPDGGSPVTDYAVQYSGDAGATWNTFADGVSADTDATVTGLTNGQAYQFRVSATNAAGTGTASGIVSATPDGTPPVITIAGDNPASIRVGAPYADAGATCTDDRDGSIAPTQAGAVDTTVAGQYTITYSCTDSAGNTAQATRTVTVITAPGAPTGLAATPGDGRVLLSWAAPPDGGSPVTDYAVQYSGDAGATWNTFADGVSADTNATVTGLTNGQTYGFRVNATNAAGTGPASTAISVIVDAVKPTITDVTILLGASIPSITVSFDEVIDSSATDLTKLSVSQGDGSNDVELSGASIFGGGDADFIIIRITDPQRAAIRALSSPQLEVDEGAFSDLAGNEIEATNHGSSTTTSDHAPPTISSVTLNLNNGNANVTTTFSEYMNASRVYPAGLSISQSDGSNDVELAGATVHTKTNSPTIIIALTEQQRADIQRLPSRQLEVDAGAFYDIDAEPNSAPSGDYGIDAVIPDTTRPAISSVTLNLDASGNVTITFDEHIDVSETDLSQLSVSQGDGSGDVELAGAAVHTTADGTVVVIALTEQQRAGIQKLASRQLEADAGAFSDLAGNQIEAVSHATTVTDSTPPVISSIMLNLDNKDANVTIEFNEAVDVSETDLSQLSVSESGGSNDVELSGAAVHTTADGTVVVIALTEQQRAGIQKLASRQLEADAGAFSDLAGNQIAAGDRGFDAVTPDGTPPTISSAALNLNNNGANIMIIFDEHADVSETDLAGLSVSQSGGSNDVELAGATMHTTADSTTVTITLTEQQRAGIQKLASRQLEADAGAFSDLAGNQIAAGDHGFGAVTPDTAAPTIRSAALNLLPSSPLLLITFDETIDVSTTDLTKMSVSQGDGSDAVELSGANVDTIADGIRVAIGITEQMRADIQALSSYRLNVGAAAFADIAGNDIAPVNYGAVTTDSTPPTITSVTLNLGNGNANVTVTFDEYVDVSETDLTQLSVSQITDGSGDVELSGAGMHTTADSTTVTITLTEQQRAGIQKLESRQLEADAGAFSDLLGNAIAATTHTPTVTLDAVRPTVSSAALNLHNDNANVTITFDETIDVSATDLAKLSVSQGDGSDDVELAGATRATNTDGTAVVITLTEQQRVAIQVLSSHRLEVDAGAFADLAGNAIEATANNFGTPGYTITRDTAPPAVTSPATAAFTEHAAGTHALTSDEQGVTFAIVSHNATGSPLPAIAGSTLSWTPSEEHGGNKYRVTVSATDASDNVGTQDVIITVTETNEDPVLANIGPRSASPGAELLISLSAADSDVPQDALAYARNGTSGAITATSTRAASFAWTPTGADLGPHVIRFTVSDGAGGTDSEDVVITVSDETAPAIPRAPPPHSPSHAAGTHALTSDERGVTFAIAQRDRLPAARHSGQHASPPRRRQQVRARRPWAPTVIEDPGLRCPTRTSQDALAYARTARRAP